MFINHKHKFIFIHIPKNAGTSIRNSFQIEGYDKKVVNKPYPHNSCSEIKNYCGDLTWETFYKFAVIRNPYERMVSYYHFHKSPQYRFAALANRYTFSDWLVKGLDNNLKKTQSDYLDIKINQIGRVETLQEDFDLFCDLIRIPSYTLPKYNVSKHEHWETYYSDEDKEIVYGIFQDDFDRFGFPI